MSREFTPDPVDVHVGARIRLRRKQLGQSQEALAEAIGLTFQQVQKYERAANRISASMLHRVGKAQGLPESYYFEGLDQPEALEISAGAEGTTAFLASAEGWKVAEAFVALPAKLRRAALRVAQDLGEAA